MKPARWYAAAVVRLRWVIVAGWALFVIVLSLLLPTLESTGGTGGFRGFAEADNPAIQTEIRSFEKFGFPVLTRTAIVQHNPDGLPVDTQFRVVSNALEFNLDRPPELQRIEFALPVMDNFLPSRFGQEPTTAITYFFYRPDVGFGRQTGLAAEYAGRYASDPEDHLVGVTGVIPGRVAQLVILRRTLEKVELATVILILLVVALNFRALGAPLVTMVTAGVALTVIVRLTGWIGEELGIDVPSEIEPVMVALLLGIVTDYSIFFLSVLKERLVSGDDRLEAARSSTEEFAPIVLVAGLTVAAGSLALLVARVGLFRTFGPGMAITVLISLFVAVTLVPACLAILGRWVFWPNVPRPDLKPATVAAAQPVRRGHHPEAEWRAGGPGGCRNPPGGCNPRTGPRSGVRRHRLAPGRLRRPAGRRGRRRGLCPRHPVAHGAADRGHRRRRPAPLARPPPSPSPAPAGGRLRRRTGQPARPH